MRGSAGLAVLVGFTLFLGVAGTASSDSCFNKKTGKGEEDVVPWNCFLFGDLKLFFKGGVSNTGGGGTDPFHGPGIDRDTEQKSTRDWGLGWDKKPILRHIGFLFSGLSEHDQVHAVLLDPLEDPAKDKYMRFFQLLIDGSTVTAAWSRGRVFEENLVGGVLDDSFTTDSKVNVEGKVEVDVLKWWRAYSK